MPGILINNFTPGLLTQPSDSDLPDGAAKKAENCEITDLGKLGNQKGNLLSQSGPTGVTIISGIQYEFNLPSPVGRKKVWLIYGQDGSGRDELWWKPYWDPETEAWVEAWQELTEFEGPYTADAGTTTTNLRSASLLQSTNDYYNRFLVLNLNRRKSMVVNDYAVTATQDLTLEAAITGQTTGDTFFIYRYPLFMNLEGPHTADAGTDETHIVDADLRVNIDDFYNNWKLYNTVRHSTEPDDAVIISDFDAGENKLTHPNVASQQSGDTYYLYNEKHNIRVQDKARFFPRENAIEISLGNDEGYPIKAPLWFGFISKRWYLNKDAFNDTTFEGFWLTRNVMKKPDSSIMIVADSGSGTLAEDTYYFKVSYIYDGYQEGPLSESVSLNPAGTNDILIDLELPLYYSDSSRKSGYFDPMLDRRVTHVIMYAAKGDNADRRDDYYRIFTMPIVNLFIDKNGVTQWVAETTGTDGLYELSGAVTFNDNLWASGSILQLTLSKVNLGKFLRWDARQGHKSESVDANFKFRATLEEQHYKAPVFTDIQRDAFANYSVLHNSDGVPVDDVIPIQNRINLGPKGVVQITGLHESSGFLLILSKRKIFRYAPGQQLLELPSQRGNIADNGSIEVEGEVYFIADDDVYEFTAGSLPVKLMETRIADQWRAISVTNKESALMGYNRKRNHIWIQTGDGSVFIYDRNFKNWRTHNTSITPVYFVTGVDGELYAVTANSIYEMESNSFTEIITIDWRSKVFNFTKQANGKPVPISASIKETVVKFKSPRKVQIQLFDPSKSETYAKKTLNYFPQTLNKEKSKESACEVDQLEIRVADVDQGTAQPATEIDWIYIDYDEVTN